MINIQDEAMKIHHQYGTSEMANYKLQLLAEQYAKEYHESEVKKLRLQNVSNSLPDGFWFEDEHGHKVTVIGYFNEWCLVEDIHHEEPYCLPFGYVQTIYDEMVAEGNEC